MATKWEANLGRFQHSLELFRDDFACDWELSAVQLEGSREQIEGEGLEAIGRFFNPIEKFFVLTLNPNRQLLLIVSCYGKGDPNPRAFEILKSKLREMHNLLHEIPERVAPFPSIPPMPNRLDGNFALWGLMLLWLGGRKNHAFRSILEFHPSTERFLCGDCPHLWDEFAAVPECDMLSLVTQTFESGTSVEYWVDAHTKAGRTFPPVLSARLSKPVVYASLNAVDFLIQTGIEKRPPQRNLKSTRPECRGGDSLQGIELELHAALREHHDKFDGPYFGHLSQANLAKEVGVSQPTVARTLPRLFDRVNYRRGASASKRYRIACEEGVIVELLKCIENPRQYFECAGGNLNFIADKDGERDDDKE